MFTSPHRQINSRVDTQRSVLGWERPARVLHDDGAPRADVAVDNKLVIEATLGAGVVGLADGQEVGREASRHHLARVDEDVCRKQAECKHTCRHTYTQREIIALEKKTKTQRNIKKNSSHHDAIATKYQAAVGYDYQLPTLIDSFWARL